MPSLPSAPRGPAKRGGACAVRAFCPAGKTSAQGAIYSPRASQILSGGPRGMPHPVGAQKQLDELNIAVTKKEEETAE